MAPSRQLGELFYTLRARTEGLKKDFDEAERQAGKFTAFILANPVAAFAALGAAALTVAVKAAKMAEEVEGSLKRVAAAVPTGAAGLDRLQKQIADISKETGRSQAELGKAAETAARTGAESAEAVGQRLKAATLAADATGEDLQGLFGSLDQVLDLFGKSSADASTALAALFVAARGRTSLTELLATLQAAAPGAVKLGLDLDTATRALVALGEKGLSARQAGAELKALAEQGEAGRKAVVDLAEAIPKATNPLGELAAAADEANSSGERLAAKLREQLNAELIDLGTKILPTAIGALEDLQRLFGSQTAANFKNNVSVILAFGDAIAAARSKTDVFNTSFKESERAISKIAEAVRDGEASLKDLSRVELTDLQARFLAISKQSLIGPQTKADLASLLKQIEVIKLAQLKEAKTSPVPTGSPTKGLLTADKLRELDELARKAAVNISLGLKGIDAQIEKTANNLARELQSVFAGLTTNGVDDLVASLATLQEQLREKGASEAFIRQIAGIQSAIIEAKGDAEALDKFLADVRDSGLPPLRQASELTAKRFQLETNLALITKDDVVSQQRLAAVKAQIAQVDAELARLAGDNAGHTAALESSTASWAGFLENAASAAFGIVTAFAGANSEAAHLIGALSNIASAVANIQQLAAAKGGLAALLSSAGGIASVLPALGGIIGGIGALFSSFGGAGKQESPEVKALRATMEKNNERLKDLHDSLGEFGKLTVASATAKAIIATPTTQLQTVHTDFGDFQQTVIRNAADIISDLRKAGVALEDLRKAASDLGLGLSDPPTAEELNILAEAVRVVGVAVKQFNEAQSATSARQEFGVINAQQAAEEAKANFQKAFGQKFGNIDLSGLDFSSLDAFKESFKKVIEAFSADGVISEAEQAVIDGVRGVIEKWEAATPKVKTAGDKFNDAMEAWSVSFEFSGADAATRLAKVTELFKKFFPELAASIDFTSDKGFDDSLQKIIDAFSADGILTDAEKEQIDWLRRLRDAFHATVPEAEKFIDALDVMAERFEIFATSKADQFSELIQGFAFKGGKFDVLKGIADGLDLTKPEGLAELKKRGRLIFEFLAAGGLTAEEQAVVDALKRILSAGEAVFEEAVKKAEDDAAKAAAKRKEIRDQADREIAVNDITDPIEQFKIRFAAAVKSIPGLAEALGGLDVATEEGRKALDDLIADWVTHPEELAALADQLGIPVEELINVLMAVEAGSDEATAALQGLADAAKTFADSVNKALSDVGFEIELQGITDNVAKLVKTFDALAKIDPRIAKAGEGLDLTTEAGRATLSKNLQAAAAGTTDPEFRTEVLALLRLGRDIIPKLEDAAGAGAAPASAGGRESLASVAGVTEVTANRMADFLGQTAANTKETAANTAAMLQAFMGRVQPLVPPSLSHIGTGGQTFNSAGGVNIAMNVSFPIELAAGATLDFLRFKDMMEKEGLPWLKDVFARDLSLALQFRGDTKIR